jgi:tRNA-binding EMAP/Myf-like protein
MKIKLKVAKVLEAEKVEGSEKLLKLSLNAPRNSFFIDSKNILPRLIAIVAAGARFNSKLYIGDDASKYKL